jgi:hypothetical protein
MFAANTLMTNVTKKFLEVFDSQQTWLDYLISLTKVNSRWKILSAGRQGFVSVRRGTSRLFSSLRSRFLFVIKPKFDLKSITLALIFGPQQGRPHFVWEGCRARYELVEAISGCDA